jgi:pyridoxal phosphate enzyme (YggS family)
MIEM